jgi:hypothetical protein
MYKITLGKYTAKTAWSFIKLNFFKFLIYEIFPCVPVTFQEVFDIPLSRNWQHYHLRKTLFQKVSDFYFLNKIIG